MWALDSAALALASHIGLALDSSGSTDAATPAPRALVLDITSALSASELSVQDELGASQQQQHALKVLASFIPTQLRSPVAAQLVGDSAPAASSSSAANELLSAISVLALSKPLTLPAFCAFRPLALDLGSRWLEALGFDEQSASFKSLQQVAIEHMDVCAALVALIPHAPELHILLRRLLELHPAYAESFPVTTEQGDAAFQQSLLTLHALLFVWPSLPGSSHIVWPLPPAAVTEALVSHPHRGTRALALKITERWGTIKPAQIASMRDELVLRNTDHDTSSGMVAPMPPYPANEWREHMVLTFGPDPEPVEQDMLKAAPWRQEYLATTTTANGRLAMQLRTWHADPWTLEILNDTWRSAERDLLAMSASEHEASTAIEQLAAQGALSKLCVSVAGAVLFREGIAPVARSTSTSASAPPVGIAQEVFVETSRAKLALRQLARAVSSRRPTLVSGSPSSGKASLIRQLWRAVHSVDAGALTPFARQRAIVTINLADRSLDSKSLLGSLASAPPSASAEGGAAGTTGLFRFVEGAFTSAIRQGRWIVLEDIDRASTDVLTVIKVVVERLASAAHAAGDASSWHALGAAERDGGVGVRVSNPASSVAAHADDPQAFVPAGSGFMLFATRSVDRTPSIDAALAAPSFFGAHFFSEVDVGDVSLDEAAQIVQGRFPTLASVGENGDGKAVKALVGAWDEIKRVAEASAAKSGRRVGLRDLLKWCRRVEGLLPRDVDLNSLESNPSVQEDVFVEARDVFLAPMPSTATGTGAAAAIALVQAVVRVLQTYLGLSDERAEWVMRRRVPAFEAPTDDDSIEDGSGDIAMSGGARVKIGRVGLQRDQKAYAEQLRTERKRRRAGDDEGARRPFALTKPSLLALEKVAAAVQHAEPALLVGETGTGKTAAVGYLAHALGKKLTALNLSNQTEASDLVGGFKPLDEAEDARRAASVLVNTFVDVFGRTFNLTRNAEFVNHVRRAFDKQRWQRLVGLFREAQRMASTRLAATDETAAASSGPRKRRKVEDASLVSAWRAIEAAVGDFDIRHVARAAKGRFVFSFVEGPLAQAIRNGDWVLLDEVNLASPETLESLATLLQTPDSSLVLSEQGDLEPIPRHPEFRLFACMNPATDVGKRDLPPALRDKFSELYVPAPDEDKEALLSIVQGYIGAVAVGDRGAVLDVSEFYSAIKTLSTTGQLADGANQPPHFSMRTLARALMFAADHAESFGLRRALYEGIVLSFTMLLEPESVKIVEKLVDEHIVSKARNPRTLLSQTPAQPSTKAPLIRIGPYWLETGDAALQEPSNYILTPSVQAKVLNLSRAVLTRRVPVLVQGPTSAGKTSVIEYLARRTGHRFVRINNHEHTDIQEYIGTYLSDPTTGQLAFQEGILVRALRRGDWLVLDELNLAPTDVLEALNRLLDDNRELVIAETGEVVRPHPHFMLFATQNPPGLYGGRKVLSRAFRNRFLEMHFGEVPQSELETILCQRCRIAPSYAKKIVAVFLELQRRRQAGRVFEEKHAFATLRDLFRWGDRGSVGYEQLAADGYMLLAERTRRLDDKVVVKEVIEREMRVKIDESRLYDFGRLADMELPAPAPDSAIVWTKAMRRLYVLIAASLRRDEPVLLVGETGAGKTSICQALAQACGRSLHILNLHQNTETADLLGGQRPIRNRAAIQARLRQEAVTLLGQEVAAIDFQQLVAQVEARARSETGGATTFKDLARQIASSLALFEWHDGPLVQAMSAGDHVLLDEISLADDSVLERLNSVLEPSRSLVLAEKGGHDLSDVSLNASAGFQLLATMNPGGDFGKKELSPALRNRFTEIWVPAVDDREDLLEIVGRQWRDARLTDLGPLMLDFISWVRASSGSISVLGLRDILAWVEFINRTAVASNQHSVKLAFREGAFLAIVDGLGANISGSSTSAMLQRIRDECDAKICALVDLQRPDDSLEIVEGDTAVAIGRFAVPVLSPHRLTLQYSLQAPTTRKNAMRLFRALQLTKPVLLEGSPGVGKTSLVAAAAALTGHQLVRINLSDQTDLMDLFGSDLPVEGGEPGEFVWKDAPFLSAMQSGAWVLLDEMNLASQAVLEGLNSCLDHRGEVYIPELDRTFKRDPEFRIFAAQNPTGQGGGRKGLPKSFVNRFTVVFLDELLPSDLLAISRALHPLAPEELLQRIIAFNVEIERQCVQSRAFGLDGAPWEFNLRDILRWLSMTHKPDMVDFHGDVEAAASLIYVARFRSMRDRIKVAEIYSRVFGGDLHVDANPRPLWNDHSIHIGRVIAERKAPVPQTLSVLARQALSAAEGLLYCLKHDWLAIVTGPRSAGKTTLVRQLAGLRGSRLVEFTMNSETDTSDLLGGFEQVDAATSAARLAIVYVRLQAAASRQRPIAPATVRALRALKSIRASELNRSQLEGFGTLLLDGLLACGLGDTVELARAALAELATQRSAAQFAWRDGVLVQAMREGSTLVLEDANLCSPSVLDRLNSLFDSDNGLQLSERGPVNGELEVVKPHADFRIVMTLDPRNGELSRAMRNRGIEICLPSPFHQVNETRVEAQSSAALVAAAHLHQAAARALPDATHILSTFDQVQATMAVRLARQLLGITDDSNALELAARQVATDSGLLAAVRALRARYAARYGLAASCMSLSPSDLGLGPATHRLGADARVVGDALVVALKAVYELASYSKDTLALPVRSSNSLTVWQQSLKDVSASEGLDIDTLAATLVHPLARGLLALVRSGESSSALDVVDLASHLRKIAHVHDVDYAALRYVLTRLNETLLASESPAADLVGMMRPLLERLSLSTGHRLLQLWRAFLPLHPMHEPSGALGRRVLTITAGKQLTPALRRDLVDAAVALHTTPRSDTSRLVATLESLEETQQSAVIDLSSKAQALVDATAVDVGLSAVTHVLKTEQMAGHGAHLLEMTTSAPSVVDLAFALKAALASGDQGPASALLQAQASISATLAQMIVSTGTHTDITRSALLSRALAYSARLEVPYEDLERAKTEAREVARSQVIAAASQQLNREHALVRWLSGMVQSLELGLAATDFSSPRTLSGAFVDVGLRLWELYVPDVPLDPVADALAHRHFSDAQRARALHDYGVHKALEAQVTSNASNPRLEAISQRVATLSEDAANSEVVSLPRNENVPAVSALFRELVAFHSRFLSPQKVARLSSSDCSCAERQGLMDTISTLAQRLSIAYSEVADVVAPVQLAISCLSIGLALGNQASVKATDSVAALARGVTAFPRASHVGHLADLDVPLSLRPTPDALPPADMTLFQLACNDQARHWAVVPSQEQRSRSAVLIERLYKVWAADRRQLELAKEKATSLYRTEINLMDEQDEAAQEAREFGALFPSYEAAEADDAQETPSGPRASFSTDHKSALVRLHLSLFKAGARTARDSHVGPALVSDILRLAGDSIDSQLDADAAAYRVRLLADISAALVESPAAANFYTDPNVAHVSKAIQLVSRLRDRLAGLRERFPDQMALQALAERCSSIMGLNTRAPVAQVLTALEQLLSATDDWEKFASREHSIAPERSALIEQIVEWRQLELASWARLLDDVRDRFQLPVCDFWIGIYESTIVAASSAEGEVDFAEVAKLLSTFMSSSSSGQYRVRLSMLRAFSRHASEEASDAAEPAAANLRSMSTLLDNVAAFYAQHLASVDAHVVKERTKAEGEVRDVIKLASWKDVNVYALRQSAVRSHHSLFKVVKRYRAALQQSASDHFGTTSPQSTRIESASFNSVPELPPNDAGLRDLGVFWRKLQTLAERFSGDGLSEHIDGLTATLLEEVKLLRDENVQGETEEERKRQAASLLSRKKRGWSDLLRELRRLGLGHTAAPQFVAQLDSSAHLYSLPPIPSPFLPSTAAVSSMPPLVDSAERLHQRILALLPVLLRVPATHHADVSTRDVQRGLGSLFNALDSAHGMRRDLSATYEGLFALCDSERRLRQAAEGCDSQPPRMSQASLQLAVRETETLVAALREGVDALTAHAGASDDCTSPNQLKIFLGDAVDNLTSKSGVARTLIHGGIDPGLWTRDEALAWQELTGALESVCALADTQVIPSALAYLWRPLSAALRSAAETVNSAQSPASASSEALVIEHDELVNAVLVAMQELSRLERSDVYSAERDELVDAALKNGVKDARESLKLARVPELAARTVNFSRHLCAHLSGSSPAHQQVSHLCARVAPFVTRMAQLAASLAEQAAFAYRAQLKFMSVLADLLLEVSDKGFCRPAEEEQESSADAQGQAADGTGMGEGSGSKDVTDEIEDEAQVEGLQNEQKEDRQDDGQEDGEDNAMEMDQDFEGEMEDAGEDKEQEGSDDGSDEREDDMDEQVGDVDPLDPSALDEKFWNEEDEENKDEEQQKQSDQVDSAGQQQDSGEMTGRDDEPDQGKKPQDTEAQPDPAGEDGASDEEDQGDDSKSQDDEQDRGEEDAGAQETQNDAVDMAQEDKLDLPEELDLPDDAQDQQSQEADEDMDMPAPSDADDASEHGDEPDTREAEADADADADGGDAEPEQQPEDELAAPEAAADETMQENGAGTEASQGQGGDTSEMAAADLATSEGPQSQAQQGERGQQTRRQHAQRESSPERDQDSSKDADDVDQEQRDRAEDQQQSQAANQGADADAGNATASVADRQQAGDNSSKPLPEKAQRSLGDALKSIERQLHPQPEVVDSADAPETVEPGSDDQQDVGYVEEGQEAEQDRQAFGPAEDAQLQGLRELQLHEQDQQAPMEEDDVAPQDVQASVKPDTLLDLDAEPTAGVASLSHRDMAGTDRGDGGEDTEMQHQDIKPERVASPLPDDEAEPEEVEKAMLRWRTGAETLEDPAAVWRKYESLTRDLSFSLTEQLRLILEPTLASRLRGDYRSGKRLNMKKIIPYIASEFTKDKIWLRRTRPSHREYQIVVAIDDSRSMADSHSIHLAYQSLALITRALTRLEAGDVAVARFGEAVDFVHPFNSGPVSDERGAELLGRFTFSQQTTDVRLLVERSLEHLQEARAQAMSGRASAAAADLWQMQIIISDGMCQDHAQLRALLRRAAEQRVMFVFIVVDSLHTAPGGGATAPAATDQNSIVNMRSVAYARQPDGRMELEMTRYLDTFPFEYFVVLRDIEALPEILGATLRQFFERISADSA